jgi:hypothetical protein
MYYHRDPGLGRGCFLYFAEVVIFIFVFIHLGRPRNSLHQTSVDQTSSPSIPPLGGEVVPSASSSKSRRFAPDTRAVLAEISAACHTCQTFSRAPLTFQISLPGDVKFNRQIRLDLMFLPKREPVLHVADAGTNFNAATFLKGESSAAIWNALLLC